MLNLTGLRSAKEGVKFMQKMRPRHSKEEWVGRALEEIYINTSQLRFQVSSSVQKLRTCLPNRLTIEIMPPTDVVPNRLPLHDRQRPLPAALRIRLRTAHACRDLRKPIASIALSMPWRSWFRRFVFATMIPWFYKLLGLRVRNQCHVKVFNISTSLRRGDQFRSLISENRNVMLDLVCDSCLSRLHDSPTLIDQFLL